MKYRIVARLQIQYCHGGRAIGDGARGGPHRAPKPRENAPLQLTPTTLRGARLSRSRLSGQAKTTYLNPPPGRIADSLIAGSHSASYDFAS